MTTKAAALAALTAAYDATDPMTDEGDLIAAVRDYLAGTFDYADHPRILTAATLDAEVAYAFIAGVEHATADTAASRRAFAALRKAGLTL